MILKLFAHCYLSPDFDKFYSAMGKRLPPDPSTSHAPITCMMQTWKATSNCYFISEWIGSCCLE